MKDSNTVDECCSSSTYPWISQVAILSDALYNPCPSGTGWYREKDTPYTQPKDYYSVNGVEFDLGEE